MLKPASPLVLHLIGSSGVTLHERQLDVVGSVVARGAADVGAREVSSVIDANYREPPPETVVLVIDDGAEARDLYRAWFELQGFGVEAAEDGPAGLLAATRLQPDAIVLDYSMPHMDGGEVLRRLKADPRTREIPVIMLTAVPDLVTPRTRAACSAFLEKPCEPDRLMQTVEALAQGPARSPVESSD